MSNVKISKLALFQTAMVRIKQEAEDTWTIHVPHGHVLLNTRELRDLGFCLDAMRGDGDAKESNKSGGDRV